MASTKIAISLDEQLLNRLDELVSQQQFASRSRAIQDAVREKLAQLDRTRLARECRKLDPRFEQDFSEQNFAADIKTWPEY